MKRRDFIRTAAFAAIRPSAPARLVVPVHRVMDARAQCPPEQLRLFWWSIWPEAVRDFGGGGIELQTSDGRGEVRRSPGDKPIFIGLRRGVINLVLTDHIPMKWDNGRASAGVTTLYDGYYLCLVALRYAHGNQIPFLSVNTCVHELLHALLQDILVSRPKWFQAGGREFRIDWYATRLWLFPRWRRHSAIGSGLSRSLAINGRCADVIGFVRAGIARLTWGRAIRVPEHAGVRGAGRKELSPQELLPYFPVACVTGREAEESTDGP